MYVKDIPSHHIRDDLKLGSFNIGFDDHSEMGCGTLTGAYFDTGLHKLWQPGSLAMRKWKEIEKMKRK